MIGDDHDLSAGPRLARAAGRFLFGEDVAGYQAGRIGYPDDLYRRLFALTGDPARVDLLEIGGGTGLATEGLLSADPHRLSVVEPDSALAAHLRARFGPHGVEVIGAGFIEAEIEGRFDLIASAASFHWMDPKAALARAAALLRPGGHIAIWWNVYRQRGIGDPLADRIVPLLADMDLPPSEGIDGHYSLDADLHRAQFAAAGFTLVAEHVYRTERTLSPAGIRALYASYSFVRALEPARRGAFLDSLDRIVAETFGGAAPNVVLTPLYVARAPH